MREMQPVQPSRPCLGDRRPAALQPVEKPQTRNPRSTRGPNGAGTELEIKDGGPSSLTSACRPRTATLSSGIHTRVPRGTDRGVEQARLRGAAAHASQMEEVQALFRAARLSLLNNPAQPISAIYGAFSPTCLPFAKQTRSITAQEGKSIMYKKKIHDVHSSCDVKKKKEPKTNWR